MVYLDTSAAVPLFVPEPASERVAADKQGQNYFSETAAS